MWGEVYQDLLKRVGASLEKLKTLGRKTFWKEGIGQVYEDERTRGKRDKRSTFGNDKLDSLPPGRTRSRRRWCWCPCLEQNRAPSRSGPSDKKGFKPRPKAALVHRRSNDCRVVGAYFGIHVYQGGKRLRGSANKSEADGMQNRPIQNDVGCMNTSSPSCMAVKSLLAAAKLPFLERSALPELLGLSRPYYFQLSFSINCPG